MKVYITNKHDVIVDSCDYNEFFETNKIEFPKDNIDTWRKLARQDMIDEVTVMINHYFG